MNHNKLWKNLKRDRNTIPLYLCPEKPVFRIRIVGTGYRSTNGSELGKKYIKVVYRHLAYLTYMQSTSHEMLGWMKHKLE